MTLLENVYQHLQYNGLVNNREHFSTQYLCRSKHWYAVQTHAGRDFSTAAAIQCLRNVREKQNEMKENDDLAVSLRGAEINLLIFLREKHNIIEIEV